MKVLETATARRWGVVALSLCVLGAVLRIVVYAQHRSLWYDEAALALNLVGRGFIGLLGPLDNYQTAPPLFLWAEHAVVLAFGRSEWALRALPLVIGLLTPLMMWRVGRRILPAPAAAVAVALVAFSPALVRYSAEAKPYGLDALMCLVVIDRALAAASPNARRTDWRWLAVAGVVAILSSTPSIFVLAGAVAFLGLEPAMRRDWLGTRNVALVGGTWAASFLLLAATLFRPLIGKDTPIGRFMHWYWAASFLTPDSPGLVAKLSAQTWAVLTGTFMGAAELRGSTILLVSLVVVGLVVILVSKRPAIAALLTVPMMSVAAASALQRYPIAERLVLFAAPLTALLIASAMLAVQELGPRMVERAAIVTMVFFAVVAVRGSVLVLRSSDGRQETRELIAAASTTGTPVWVSAGGEVAWRYYTRDTATVQRSGQANPLAPAGGSLDHNVLVGAWYQAIPERIVPVVDNIATASRPSPWSNTEARRVRDIARPCAMVFLSHMMPGESVAMLSGTARLGGRVTETTRRQGAELHYICFDQTESPLQQ